MRPRSSQAKAIGWVIIGSEAQALTWKPSRTVIAATASSGVRNFSCFASCWAMPQSDAVE